MAVCFTHSKKISGRTHFQSRLVTFFRNKLLLMFSLRSLQAIFVLLLRKFSCVKVLLRSVCSVNSDYLYNLLIDSFLICFCYKIFNVFFYHSVSFCGNNRLKHSGWMHCICSTSSPFP